MGIETFVLGSDRSVQDVFADLIDLDRFAILELELSQDGLAVRSIHGRCSRGAKRLRIGVVGKVLKPSVGKRRSADEKEMKTAAMIAKIERTMALPFFFLIL